MAVAVAATAIEEKFSIREYVNTMRSSSLSKCWPFGGDCGDRAAVTLPPMAVRKFRWWGDELDVLIDAPRAASMEEDVEEDEEKHTKRRKQRTPKKRSIVELFAVVPPVVAISNSDSNDTGVEEGTVPASDLEEKNQVRARGKEILLRALLSRKENDDEITKREKRTKKKKKKKIDAAMQEIMCKKEVPLAVEMPQLLKCSVKRKQMKLNKPSIDRQKKDFTKQSLTKEHRHVGTSKFMPKNWKRGAKILPLHSILKNHSRGISVKKIAVNGSMDRARNKSFRPSVKHVHFTGKDTILGQKKNNARVEFSKLQSIHKESSNVLVASSTFNRSDTVSVAINGAQVESGSGSTEVKKRTRLFAEYQQGKVVSNHHDVLNHDKGSFIHTKDNSLHASVDLNHGLQDDDNSDCIEIYRSKFSDNQPQSAISDPTATDEECLHFAAPIQEDQRSSIVSDVGTIPLVGNFLPGSCFMHVEGSERQPHALISPSIGRCGCTSASLHLGIPLSSNSAGHMSSSVRCERHNESRLEMDLYNLGNARMLKDSISLCSGRNMDTNFLGLPLNSHGELVKNANKISLSKGFEQYNTILSMDNRFSGPASKHISNINDMTMDGMLSGGVYEDDKISRVSDLQCHINEPLTYASGYIASQDGTFVLNQGPVKNQVSLLQQSHDVNKLSFKRYKGCAELHQCICRVNDLPQAEHTDSNSPSVQPTVRLMGKNVTVGRNNIDCQGHRDATPCTHKEIVNMDQYTRRVFSNKPLSKSSAGKECPPLVNIMPKENFTQFLVNPNGFFREMEGNGRPITESCFVSRNGNPLPMGKSVAPVDVLNSSFSPDAILNKTLQPSSKPMVSLEYVRSVQQVPPDFPNQDVHQHMLLSAPCNHSESVSGSKISNFDPFLNLGYVNFGQPSLAVSSSNVPSWFLNASQPTKNNNPCYMSNFQQFPVHPSSANVFVQPSPGMLVASFPAGPGASHSGYSVPSSFRKTPVIPSFAMNSSTFAANPLENEGYRRNGVICGMPQFKGPELCGKNKGVAINDDGFIRQVKKPALKMQNEPVSPACQLETQYSRGCRKVDSGKAQFHPCISNRSDLGCPVNLVKDDPQSKVRSGSSKKDCVASSGPFKLSGGTKHILMPSPTSGENNSRPIHSMVPFDAGNSASKKAISEKAAKIYSF